MNCIILLRITPKLPYSVGSTPTAGIYMTKPCTSLKTSKSRQIQGFFMLGGIVGRCWIMLDMIQIFNDLNRVHDTNTSRAEPLKVFQGSVDHLFFMVGKGMTVDTLQGAVSRVP